ncbi:MAG: hypothetical protein JSW45_07070 [Thiotrichales bacterium]|nr:MAG: hypothetical protein JSW45_07070 [Thiotrichales bacterium]
MTEDLPAHVRATVEAICELGCERVNEIIASLESDQNVAETNGLDRSDRVRVLVELKEIMAVYDNSPV